MTRIVAGSRGGRTLATPPGTGTRPTSDRVREALFSSLESMTDLAGCQFLDLFAGSGAVGLEAASRGAASVLLVESDARVARVARANIDALRLGEVCRVVQAPVRAALAATPSAHDIVFADPPYDLALDGDLAGLTPWLAPDALVVVERRVRSPEPAWPENVTLLRSRRYGDTVLWYGRRS